MTDFEKSILLNKDVIAVNQDVCPGSVQGDMFFQDLSGHQIWAKKMCDNQSWTAIMYNPTDNQATFSLSFDLFGFARNAKVCVPLLFERVVCVVCRKSVGKPKYL
eukprot:m.64221 g.64221  ORF g.64221 m.64221 type:complete len:105 (-) comp19530_c0_seq5:23-337(-)